MIKLLRDTESPPETALFDINDNSIAAWALHINAVAATSSEEPHFAIFDGGKRDTQDKSSRENSPKTHASWESDWGRFY